MRNRIWLLQIPVILFFAAAFWVTQQGIEGDLKNSFLREKVFPKTRRLSNLFVDSKFYLRGPQPPKNKIVILEVDSRAISAFGRWPWHRDKMEELLTKLIKLEPKVIGFDMVFSERGQIDQFMSDQFLKALNQPEAEKLFNYGFAGDGRFTIALAQSLNSKSKVILGWTLEGTCHPGLDNASDCQLEDSSRLDLLAKMEKDNNRLTGLQRFAVPEESFSGPAMDWKKTPLLTGVLPITNLGEFQFVAENAGLFNIVPDPDGVIRRAPLLMAFEQKLYPSLALEMARVGLNEQYAIERTPEHKIAALKFKSSEKKIPVSPLAGSMVNFRGKERTFTYVPILDLFPEPNSRIPASDSLQDIFKDAYVLIGVSALGVFDMRAFPFSSNVPGTEGHATILDNILSNDFLSIGGFKQETYAWIMIFLMFGLGIAIAITTEKLESIPALVVGSSAFLSLGFIDVKVLFSNNIHWDFSFLYLQLFTVFFLTLAAKYVMEERNKKFIKQAFSKHVAPAIVDSIIKDPSKLSLKGERRELTILFSDIRGFTSISERMEPKALAKFLNDYLGIMTDVVFDTRGLLDKYIGDAVMAFWGAPISQTDHAANAIRAAKLMMQRLEQHRDRFQKEYGVDVQIGIGINSGPVNVGYMGSERILSYTVIGDHVNLASRLEGLTKEYGAGILTTRQTLDQISESKHPVPSYRTLDFVKVKGKNESVELIQIFSAEPDAQGLQLFEEARRLYAQRNWAEAIPIFGQANEKLRANQEFDGPCRLYIERC
ncbi:MAG: adenylate/guanylate cyclase domain-containing protein, partial [Bdellovibrionales bacterium]|nr:adenylate/guanylate cyclase domain-containing protein [Bdellovibrionales bacterium]